MTMETGVLITTLVCGGILLILILTGIVAMLTKAGFSWRASVSFMLLVIVTLVGVGIWIHL